MQHSKLVNEYATLYEYSEDPVAKQRISNINLKKNREVLELSERKTCNHVNKTIESALANLFTNEFGFLWLSVIDLIVTKVMEVIDSFTPPLSTIKPGQVVWLAVDKEEKNTCRGDEQDKACT